MLQNVAIVIGVNYSGDQGPENMFLRDCDTINRRMRRTYGFEVIHMLTATSDKLDMVRDETSGEYHGAPTKANIATVFKTLQRSDKVFVYYCGHGAHGTGIAAEPYLLTSDGAKITAHTIANWVEGSPASKFVFLLDCCFAQSVVDFEFYTRDGQVVRNETHAVDHKFTGKSVLALYACSPDELAYETLDGGAFTTEFESLVSKSNGGEITIGELIAVQSKSAHRGASSTHEFSLEDNALSIFTDFDHARASTPAQSPPAIRSTRAHPVNKNHMRKYLRQGATSFSKSEQQQRPVTTGESLLLLIFPILLRYRISATQENIRAELYEPSMITGFLNRYAPENPHKQAIEREIIEAFAQSYFRKNEDILVNDVDAANKEILDRFSAPVMSAWSGRPVLPPKEETSQDSDVKEEIEKDILLFERTRDAKLKKSLEQAKDKDAELTKNIPMGYGPQVEKMANELRAEDFDVAAKLIKEDDAFLKEEIEKIEVKKEKIAVPGALIASRKTFEKDSEESNKSSSSGSVTESSPALNVPGVAPPTGRTPQQEEERKKRIFALTGKTMA